MKKGRANMVGIAKVHELLDELHEAVQKLFPEMTNASFSTYCDGYRAISILKWDQNEGKPTEDRKFKMLFEQRRSTFDGKWGEDGSETYNATLKKDGFLLGGED
jgi:hypothetical protein